MLNRKTFLTYLLQKNIKRPKITNRSKTRVLIVTYDAIGDMVMTIPLINAIHKKQPNWQLELLSSPRSFPLIQYHPALQHIWSLDINRPFGKLDNKGKKQLKILYKQEFDILIYLGERISSATLWRLSNITAIERLSLPFTEKKCRHKGIDPLQSRLFDRYIGLSNEEETHFCHRMLSILPDLQITPSTEIDLSLYLPKTNLPNIPFPSGNRHVLFNPTGSQDGNTLAFNQVNEIIPKLTKLSLSIFMFDTTENRKIVNDNQEIYWLPSANILVAAQWLTKMDLTLTTDTSIGHISVAQSRPTIIMRSNEQWRDCCDPISKNVQMLRAESEDIKSLSSDLIIQAVKQKLNL